MLHMFLSALTSKYKNLLYLGIILLLCIPVILPLLRPGFFVSDDGEWMVIRFAAFHQTLRSGQFPPRFLFNLNHGYGYPVADFLYPGFMYMGEIIHLVGIGFVNTIKVILVFGMVSSGFFMFLWLSRNFNKVASLVGSLFFLYAPYHLFDLYKRGSVGEILALAVVPFVFWQIERRSFLWTSLGIGMLILSHNTLALLFLPIIFCYLMLFILITPIKKRKQLVYEYILTVLLGIGVSSFFLMPALFDLKYTVFSKTNISEWDKYFAQIDLIGAVTLITLVGVFVFIAKKKISLQKHRLTLLFFIICFLATFLSVPMSGFLWTHLPVSVIQFPFRLLSVTIVAGAFLVAFIFSQIPDRLKTVVGIIFVISIILQSIQFISPYEYFDKGEGFYTTNQDTTTVKNEYMPKWVKVLPSENPFSKAEIDVGVVKDQAFGTQNIKLSIQATSDTTLTIHRVYFPGWKVFVDGKEENIIYDNPYGLITIPVSAGKHDVEAKFQETPFRLLSDMISIVSFISLLVLGFLKRKTITIQ